jgi:hypothetical protein
MKIRRVFEMEGVVVEAKVIRSLFTIFPCFQQVLSKPQFKRGMAFPKIILLSY